MSMLQEDFENIEKYINGSLEGEALELFEKQIKNNPELAQNIEKEGLLQDAIEEEGFRIALDDFHTSLTKQASVEETSSKGKVISLRFWMKYAAVACVAILITWGGVTFLTNTSQNKNEQLFATHFKPDPGLPTTMSVSDNYSFYEAMVSYKQGKYEEAIVKWEVLLKEKPKNDTLNYFLGVANLANGNEDEAITFLQWTTEHQESYFLPDAHYYLGLANIKKGNLSKGEQLLKLSKLPKSSRLLKELETN